MDENFYTGLWDFGDIRAVHRNKNREQVVFDNFGGFAGDFVNSGVIFWG